MPMCYKEIVRAEIRGVRQWGEWVCGDTEKWEAFTEIQLAIIAWNKGILLPDLILKRKSRKIKLSLQNFLIRKILARN